jgi:hypothetical protein
MCALFQKKKVVLKNSTMKSKQGFVVLSQVVQCCKNEKNGRCNVSFQNLMSFVATDATLDVTDISFGNLYPVFVFFDYFNIANPFSGPSKNKTKTRHFLTMIRFKIVTLVTLGNLGSPVKICDLLYSVVCKA